MRSWVVGGCGVLASYVHGVVCVAFVAARAGGSWLFLLHKDHYSQITKFLVSANARHGRLLNGPRMVLKVRRTLRLHTQCAATDAMRH